MARRQEQETAREEVTELAPDVLRMELPIRLPGLGHVNCYAITDRDGVAVVDPGLPGPSAFRALQVRLKQIGMAPRHVHTVIVTHSHPDHFGGATQLAKEAGAKIVAHRAFGFGPPAMHQAPEVSVDDLDAQREDDEERRRTMEQLASTAKGKTPWGSERQQPSWRTRLKWRALGWVSGRIVPHISDPVEHGDVMNLAGREWFVVHTPGHTTDHFCLHDPETGIFLAGDHVLPTITPHIAGMASSHDPLASYFYSLDRVAEIANVGQVLPAHGHPFEGLAGRTVEIKEHHVERLAMVKQISRNYGRPATVNEFSQHLFKPRSQGPMADSETFAHLEHLRLAGEADLHVGQDGLHRYVSG
ncbi:MAG: MBL fold metallo-hydrolase [Deltaproteobacteria bacterium]|nr:MBL fold metallo-hydrolase [Deltaproteobacteria bacterium]MBW2363136.1 MBL fold metallo-hydrolase [Deltaproteobacteria bacterium]